MARALFVVLTLGLLWALWLLRRSGTDSADRQVAKVQVFLWSGLLFGNLPNVFGFQPPALMVVSFSLSGLFFLATVVQLVRAKRIRQV